MDRLIVERKLDSLQHCLARIEAKQPVMLASSRRSILTLIFRIAFLVREP